MIKSSWTKGPGIKSTAVLPEPAAAGVAYLYHRYVRDATVTKLPRTVMLVIDFGGGTFDVAVITVSGGTLQIKVIASYGMLCLVVQVNALH